MKRAYDIVVTILIVLLIGTCVVVEIRNTVKCGLYCAPADNCRNCATECCR